jgi:DNA-binding PadR family transcriptional regulator
MDEIQKHTGGTWKPSPGSIYPLLAWLQDNTCIKELPTENGFKRYELTQSGKELLEEQKKIRDQFTQNSGFLAGPFFDGFFGKLPQEKSDRVRASTKRLFVATIKLSKALRDNYSEKELDEALKALDEASTKLEQIKTRLAGE